MTRRLTTPARLVAAALVAAAVGLGVYGYAQRDALRTRYHLHLFRAAPDPVAAKAALAKVLAGAPANDPGLAEALRVRPEDVRITWREKKIAPKILFDVEASIENVSGRRLVLFLDDAGDLVRGARLLSDAGPEGEFRPLDRMAGGFVCVLPTASYANEALKRSPPATILDPGATCSLEVATEVAKLYEQAHATETTPGIELRLEVRTMNAAVAAEPRLPEMFLRLRVLAKAGRGEPGSYETLGVHDFQIVPQ